MAHRILTSLVGIDATFSSTLSLTSLAGVGNRMLIVNSAGTVSTQAIPVGTVTSVGLSMPSAFSVASSPVTGSGTLTVTGAGTTAQYIDGTGALQTFPTTLPSTNVQHQVKAGVAINKGQAVYVTSADGTNMIVGLASNAAEATSSKTMGLLDATVAINGFANVITEGLLAGLDTSGAGSAGDPVWLGTNGNLIYGLANKPYAPAHLVFIGIVTRKNISNGEIFVKVQNGFELEELHNVDLHTTTPVNGNILGFDGTLWVNKTIAGWLGFTPLSGTGTTNYVPKWTGSTALGNSLMYDNGTTLLVGTTTASTDYSNAILALAKSNNSTYQEIRGSSQATLVLTQGVTANSTTPAVEIFNGYNFGIKYIGGTGGAFSNFPLYYYAGDGAGSGDYIMMQTAGLNRFRIANSGNVLVGTTTDAGYKLDVNGTSVFRGNLNLIGNLATGSNRNYILGNSSNFEVTTNTYVIFRNWYNSGDQYLLLDYPNGGRATFSGTGGIGYRLAVGGAVTASTALGQGLYINPNLYAAANNDVLVGLDVNPTFTNGAYTGVSNLGLRVNGDTKITGSTSTGNYSLSVYNSSNAVSFYVRGYGDALLAGTLFLGAQNGSNYISNGTLGIASSQGTGNPFVTFSHNNGNVAFKALSNSVLQLNPSAGNVLVGTTTDAGQKLQIAGNQATTIAGTGDGFNLTRTGSYDNTTLTTLATITDTTSNANRAKTGLYVNVTNSSTNIAIQTVGAVGVGTTPPSNSFATGYFSYLWNGATVNSAANYNLNVRSQISSYAAGNGGGVSFWGDERGQAGANTAFAGIRGVKENSTYLNALGALVFLTQASSAGLSTESTFAEVGRFTSGGNFGIGTTTPSYKLDVNGTARATTVITDTITTSGSTTLASYAGTAYTYGPIVANPASYTFTYQSQPILYGNISSGYIPKANTIGMGNSLIYQSGSNNILIGTTTDNGYKFQVNGNIYCYSNIVALSDIDTNGNVNVNNASSGGNLTVSADTTSGPDNLYSGGQIKGNIYTSSVNNPVTVNTSTTVSIMNWYPSTSNGVFIDYVLNIGGGGGAMRSGTFTVVNDNAGTVQYLDVPTLDINGSTALVTLAAVNNSGTMEVQVTNISGQPVYINIITRYIPPII